jgi:hypothetical protein
VGALFWCVFGGVLLFHPGWVVSSALAGLASGFGMGPGVSLSLWTAVTLLFFVGCLVGGVGFCVGVVAWVVWVSFRPVSASSLHSLRGL